MLSFGKKQGLLGLDIGTSSVKALELRRSGKGYELRHFGMVSLPPETIVDGVIMDGGTVIGAVQQLIAEHKITTKDVAVAVSGHSVIVKPIKVPVAKPQELEEMIQFDAEQHIPFAIEDVNIDFQLLAPPAAGATEMDVLLVAVKKDIINDYLTVMTAAGLNVAVVDVDAFALENAFEATYEPGSDEVVALINIGAAVTTINIVRNGVPVFTRDSAIGGNRYTESIQKMLGLSHEQAETLKLGGEVEGVAFSDAQPAIDLVNTELAGEIRRSLDFFRSSTPFDAFQQVLISGGSARLPNLVNFLSEALEVPMQIANPLRKIKADPKQFDPDYLEYIAPQLVVSVGLAMRQAGDR